MAKRKKTETSPEFENWIQASVELVNANPDYYSGAGIFELMKQGTKEVLERLMQCELTNFLGYEKSAQGDKPTTNRRNGTSSKSVKSRTGLIELDTPRDRDGKFESRLIPKYSKDISEIQDKVIAMYARGISERDISKMIDEIYGFSLSATTISDMTDSVLPLVKQWKTRPLHKVYPFVFVDALYVDMKVERTSQKRAIYVMIGIDENGHKDVLGFWNRSSEGAEDWRTMFDEIIARGVEKVCFVSADGLKGLEKVVKACFGEKTVFQRCIVHMIRNSLKHIPRSDFSAFCNDLKKIYDAINIDAAKDALTELEQKWKTHKSAVKIWTEQFQYVEQLFNYAPEIRHVIYTTNTIESVNCALRKVTNMKGALPSEDALDKLLYLRIQDLVSKWKGSIKNWQKIKDKLEIGWPGWDKTEELGK